MEKDM